MISGIIDSLGIALRDSKNKIKFNYDNSIPENIIGDSLKLAQVIINLISNAIKFTQEGIITVSVDKTDETDNKITLLFKVSDTGKGIPLEEQANFFKDYYQESSTKKLAYKGTGLGLSIVKKTLNLLGSEIKLESFSGKGSIFSFELTFEKDFETNSESTLAEDYKLQIKDYKIIIIDDNKINLMVTRNLLEEFCDKCEVASNGYDGIEMIKNNSFDCVLVDLHMPEIDGFETAKLIKEFNKEIAIIALTAAASKEILDKANEHKLDSYILKPFLTNNLLKTIVATVKQKRKFS